MDTKMIFIKIPEIMSKVGVVGKDRTNTMQGYKFRGIDDMYNALNQHLADAKVFVTSKLLDVKREERTSAKGSALIYSILTMEFEFFAEDGSSVKSVTIGEAMDSGDKSMNKAMSTAYKYALMQIFCIPTEEEKDSEHQSPEVAPQDFFEINNEKYVHMKGISKKTNKPYDLWKNTTTGKLIDNITAEQLKAQIESEVDSTINF